MRRKEEEVGGMGGWGLGWDFFGGGLGGLREGSWGWSSGWWCF